jgi:hypothetical protein
MLLATSVVGVTLVMLVMLLATSWVTLTATNATTMVEMGGGGGFEVVIPEDPEET